jgi:hypothetical protein
VIDRKLFVPEEEKRFLTHSFFVVPCVRRFCGWFGGLLVARITNGRRSMVDDTMMTRFFRLMGADKRGWPFFW